MTKLFDAATIYSDMGLLVTDTPIVSVGTVRYLAAAAPDSTLVLFALSLANSSLSFHRDGDEFVAQYHVELAFQADSALPVRLSSDQTVRVRSYQETLRADESVLFQGFLTLRPGIYTTSLSLRDRNSPAVARRERKDTVPRLSGPSLGSPIPFYEGTGRTGLDVKPELIVNPRATLPYGKDTLRFYIEAYGLPTGTRLAAEAFDNNDTSLWRDTVRLEDTAGFASATVPLAVTVLGIGAGELRLETSDGAVRSHTPYLVSFSSRWATTNYAAMINLLRFFDRQDLVAKLRTAPPDQRAEIWGEFWTATDPVPATPENEALDAYLHRVQIANARFRETGEPGWLTDRGEVYITLGEPDEVLALSGPEISRGTTQIIRWTYSVLRLVLIFRDRGFGSFELTPTSRTAYLQALVRVRRPQ